MRRFCTTPNRPTAAISPTPQWRTLKPGSPIQQNKPIVFNALRQGVVGPAGLMQINGFRGLDLANLQFRPTETRRVPEELANLLCDCQAAIFTA
jgi:hypothetical protein